MLAVVTWFCLDFFHFLLKLSLPACLSSRAVAFCTFLRLCSRVGYVRFCSRAKGEGYCREREREKGGTCGAAPSKANGNVGCGHMVFLSFFSLLKSSPLHPLYYAAPHTSLSPTKVATPLRTHRPSPAHTSSLPCAHVVPPLYAHPFPLSFLKSPLPYASASPLPPLSTNC